MPPAAKFVLTQIWIKVNANKRLNTEPLKIELICFLFNADGNSVMVQFIEQLQNPYR